VLVLDSGDLIARDARISDATKPAIEVKADLILRAVAHSGIDGMAPGDGDLVLGLDWLTQQAEALELPYVCANLEREDGTAPFAPWRVVEVGSVKVGIFGVTGNIAECAGCKVTDATAAATAAVEALRKEGCHQIVGLSHLGTEADAALAEAVPGIDFIFAAHSRGRMRFPLVAGEGPTTIFQAGSRGRQIGRVSVTFADGAKGFADAKLASDAASQRERTAARLTDLEQKVADAQAEGDERSLRRYEQSLERTRNQYAQYAIADVAPEGRHAMSVDAISLSQTMAEETEVAKMVAAAKEKLPEDTRARRELPKIGEFAGSSRCRSCHQGAYRRWRQTTHARAYTHLVREKKGNDASCFGCHVTGYFLEGGPRSPQEVSYLRNVQCEACHGPSLKHVEKPELPTPMKGKEGETCTECHNASSHGGQGAEFELATALEQVKCDDSAMPMPQRRPIETRRVAPPTTMPQATKGEH